MATFSTVTVTRTDHRWIVPAAEPWGATATDVGTAWTVAEKAYREHHGIADDATIPGDALRFHVTDGEIVIQFTTEEPAR